MKRALAVIAALIALMLTVVACGETTALEGGEPTAAAEGLGPTVRQALLDANGVASFNELSVSSPGFAITGIDSIGRDDCACACAARTRQGGRSPGLGAGWLTCRAPSRPKSCAG